MALECDHYFENSINSNITHKNDLNSNVTHKGLDNIHIKEAPTDYTINHGGLDNIIIKLPIIKLESDSKLTSTSKVELTSTNNIHIKEIPEVRAHLPMHFNFGVKFFGLELLVFSLCGELQLITEKYIPNRWERCEYPIKCEDQIVGT